MTRECQVRFCEGLGVKLPGPTRQKPHLRKVRFWRILLQKSAAADGFAAIQLMSAGFDPPTLAALRNAAFLLQLGWPVFG